MVSVAQSNLCVAQSRVSVRFLFGGLLLGLVFLLLSPMKKHAETIALAIGGLG